MFPLTFPPSLRPGFLATGCPRVGHDLMDEDLVVHRDSSGQCGGPKPRGPS